MAMQAKLVTERVHIPRRSRSAGLSIAQLHGEHLPDHLDPFLAFDHFEMAQPFFPPHPHAGFSAVTYMFPQSQNGFVNRDSRGERIEIHPGDLHWTAAGRGIMHEEVPNRRGVVCHGLQIFIDLPAAKKWMAPEVHHLDAAAVPRVVTPTSEIRVVIGRHGDVTSPVPAPTAVTLLDVVLQPGGSLEHPVPAGETRFVYVIDGEVEVGGTPLAKGDAVGLDASGDTVYAVATAGTAHLIVGGGAPLRQPVVFHGPFCMTSREDIARAIAAYQSGAMGHLDPSF
jgi:redox-sensitive bicupin YhaK (pirin superfamily)